MSKLGRHAGIQQRYPPRPHLCLLLTARALPACIKTTFAKLKSDFQSSTHGHKQVIWYTDTPIREQDRLFGIQSDDGNIGKLCGMD